MRSDFNELLRFFDARELAAGVIGSTSRRVRRVPHKKDTDITRQEAADLIERRFPRRDEPCFYGVESPHRQFCGCVACTHFFKARLWAFLIWRYFISQESLSTCWYEFNLHRERYDTISRKRLEREVEYIRLARAGKRLDRKPSTGRKRGRPLKPTK